MEETISELKVMRSAAGWYIGRSYFEPTCRVDFPYSRESDYFPTEEAAQTALVTGNYSVRTNI